MKSHKDKFIVVTGGAGFIGSCTIKYLNEKGITNIIVVDELGTTEKWKNLVGKSFADFIPKDQFFDWLIGREDTISAFIHLGACSTTTETDASYLLENNYRYSRRLAEYALKHNHRFIYASSAATFGDGEKGFSDDHDILYDLHPLNMYGYSKHLFDLWLKDNNLLNKVVGLKYYNVFGPNEGHKGRMASAIMHILPQIQKNGVARLFKSCEPDKYKDGEQKRDFIYVKDVVRMTCAFLNNDATGIFNIGSGVASTWNQLVTALYNAVNKPVNIEYIPMPDDLIGKYQNYSCADMNKTQSVLKRDTPCMPLEESVKDYVCNYLLPGKKW